MVKLAEKTIFRLFGKTIEKIRCLAKSKYILSDLTFWTKFFCSVYSLCEYFNYHRMIDVMCFSV
jgi:hypothetical protein